MSSLNKIECIKRFIKTGLHIDLISWMQEGGILKSSNSNDNSIQLLAEDIFVSLSQAEKDGKLILLDYEWTILPREFIKITIITDKENRQFTYNL